MRFEWRLARAINNAHPAATDFFQDVIIPEPPVVVAQVDFRQGRVESSAIVCLALVETGP
jgi:hypothetical protein